MLVNKDNIERLDIPNEPGEWVGIVALTGIEMDEANSANTEATLTRMRPFLKDIADLKGIADDRDKRAESHTSFDAMALLKAAVRSWSYPEPVTPENLERLDGATRDWLHRTIWERNSRPLPTGSE